MGAVSIVPPNCNSSRPRRLSVLDTRPSLFLIESESARQYGGAVQAISKTRTLCPDEVDGGLLKGNNVFVFMLASENFTEAEVFDKTILKMHRYVASARRVGQNCFHMKVFNIYADKVVPIRILCETSVLEPSKLQLMDLFPNFDMEVCPSKLLHSYLKLSSITSF